jgi:pimeloyl-ACP methyl ester carboxylesterase
MPRARLARCRIPASQRLAFALLFLALHAPTLHAGEPTSETFTVKGVKIHYLVAGKGEPVVLIHGLYSSALMNWKAPGIMDDLARDHLVIAVDLPGHGKSDKPEGDDAYGTQLVDDVVALLDHLQIKKAHIVGYSMGGMVTLKFLTMHGNRVLSGTLGGMGWLKEGSPLQNFWGKTPAREGSRTPAAFTRNIAKLAVSAEDVQGVKAPVEILVGDHDPVRRLYVDPLKRVRGDWTVVEIADAGHITCIMKKQFRDELGAWVRRNTK